MARKWIGWVLRIGAVAGIGYLIAGLFRGPAGQSGKAFRGNPRNRVFHAPGCRYFLAASSSEEFETRDGALDAGFKPCKLCKP